MTLFDFLKRRNISFKLDFLEDHPIKDKYFYRKATFRVLDKDKIVAFDETEPRVISFDPWPQIIFLEATGKKTVGSVIVEMANAYTRAVPPLLDKELIDQIERLEESKLIAFSDVEVQLEERFANPLRNK